MKYVLEVQAAVDMPDGARGVLGWFEIARVTVPVKTRRRVAFQKALDNAKSLKLTPEGTPMRLLPAEFAEPRLVRAVMPDPVLEIE